MVHESMLGFLRDRHCRLPSQNGASYRGAVAVLKRIARDLRDTYSKRLLHLICVSLNAHDDVELEATED